MKTHLKYSKLIILISKVTVYTDFHTNRNLVCIIVLYNLICNSYVFLSSFI